MGDRVELTAVFKVLANQAGWIRVPLRLNKCVLRSPEEFKGAGKELLKAEPSGDGYVCWIDSTGRNESEITLKLLAPLATSAEESRLELNLPQAAVSKLTVRVPAIGVTATASPGSGEPVVSVAKAPAAGSDVSVLGIGGDCWMAWRKSDQPVARLSSCSKLPAPCWCGSTGERSTPTRRYRCAASGPSSIIFMCDCPAAPNWSAVGKMATRSRREPAPQPGKSK